MRMGVLARRRSAGFATITYLGKGTTGSATGGANPTGHTLPAGFAAGTLLLAFVSTSVATAWGAVAGGGSPNFTGWTKGPGYNAGGSSPNGCLYYKIATGSESAPTVDSPGGATQVNIYGYNGVDPTTPFDGAITDGVWAGSSTAVTPYPIPAQTPSMAGCVSVVHAVSNNAAATYTGNPTGHTEIYDGNVGGTVSGNYLGHRLSGLTAGVSTGVRNVTSGSVRGTGAGFLLRPAPL